MNVFEFREHIVGEYQQSTRSFTRTKADNVRAHNDAQYAHLYGLTRDELRYILDPAGVMGSNYPRETFRVLKNNEMRGSCEYCTRRSRLG